ncbi:type VI secretion system tube protein TssD [Thiohalocapsa marina]|uniref:type VI secretion system tube protein TssD n=1 Tax=Thiohalocapsa marina TaxID=424902 RepID=UPI0036DA3B41
MNRYMSTVIPTVLLMAVSVASGEEIQCRITGETLDAVVPVATFAGGIIGNYDPGSGLPTGKRQHRPVTITKKLDALSPLLFQAAVSNQTLTSMECSFHRVLHKRSQELYFRITLTQPRIVDLALNGDTSQEGAPQETLQFVYYKIALEDVLSGIVTEDYWESPVD